MRRRAAVAFAAAMMMLVALSAQAAGSVSVTLKVSKAHYSIGETCQVSVTEGSNGVAVLAAAVSTGCIDSYKAVSHPTFGTYISCIDGLCDVPGTYWAMRENCTYTDYGVDGFYANAGDELSFTYESWGHFVLPAPC